jgi:iron(III) transport system ATP-binding protein
MSFLEVSGINKTEREFNLENISFEQQKNQKIAIAGETGSGKSTLLKIIAGWTTPDKGNVFFKDERIKKIPAEKLIPGHPGISYLSQQFELPNFLSVNQVLQYANNLTENDAATLFDVCRISHLIDRRTDQLSGGEKQRIALCRLLISSPELLLLDEPFSNLDLIHKNILKNVIRDVGDRLGVSCILVSHDPQDTLSWANEIIVMKQGRIIQQADPYTIYRQPVNEYVAGLFGKFFILNKQQAQLVHASDDLQDVLIRPEDFLIVADRAKGIPATIKSIFFLGHTFEIDLDLAGDMVTIKSQSADFKVNDTIYVTLATNHSWWRLPHE